MAFSWLLASGQNAHGAGPVHERLMCLLTFSAAQFSVESRRRRKPDNLMKSPIEQLFQLQTLEERADNPEQDADVRRLRQKIPSPILGHYDRLRVRGKKGVALVRNGVCSGCHMRLASGAYATLVRGEDIMICDTCGRYLHYIPEVKPPETPAAPEAADKAKTGKRVRKKKAATPTAAPTA